MVLLLASVPSFVIYTADDEDESFVEERLSIRRREAGALSRGSGEDLEGEEGSSGGAPPGKSSGGLGRDRGKERSASALEMKAKHKEIVTVDKLEGYIQRFEELTFQMMERKEKIKNNEKDGSENVLPGDGLSVEKSRNEHVCATFFAFFFLFVLPYVETSCPCVFSG